MAMMNSEARKRSVTTPDEPTALAARLADAWDREADNEDARGNGFAAVILHQHARQLREALHPPLSA
ncbi:MULTISPECIES: hypothetical protein [unclassified Nocardioides]|jgi:hypothetical protein|uniref:hypothetical protein n=1 Tax=unclassified Nocardioides TaxID=2615069 RepID=UPI000702AA4D|nr:MULTISPECIES: hypothetical protein [unclassified Nocardioides]KRC49065.1 hypothetical protein ASE19_19460 [Nocardioides sp. Root79]KRC75466.1 hypothetical protein ASE20_21365 [Nocardioides sp. Root240]